MCWGGYLLNILHPGIIITYKIVLMGAILRKQEKSSFSLKSSKELEGITLITQAKCLQITGH